MCLLIHFVGREKWFELRVYLNPWAVENGLVVGSEAVEEQT